jgi:cobalamin-dependent methionine synthase I
VGVAAVTIGDGLEVAVADLADAGEMAEASILDAYGSELAEAAADLVDGLICREASGLGGAGLSRTSPGYGDFPLEQQRALVDLVEAPRIGIRLGDSMILTPRKSVTFAKPIATTPSESLVAGGSPCSSCRQVGCAFRRPQKESR